jgi:hypothetical protein
VKILVLLASVVGISLVGQLGIELTNQFGRLLPFIVARITLMVMFWISFVLLIIAIVMFAKLGVGSKTKKKKQSLVGVLFCPRIIKTDKKVRWRALTLLAMIIAIAHIGQLGIKGVQFIGETLLPTIIVRIIFTAFFWIALIFVVIALIMYKKL